MSTIAIVAIGTFLLGFLTGGMVIGLNDGLSDGFFGIISFFLRPSLPLYFWLHQARDTSGWMLSIPGSEDARFITDGNEWGALFLRENSRVGFSPLLLIPAGLVRVAIRIFGRKVTTGLTDNRENGYIFTGLRVAPGLILIRRRPEDIGYMERTGYFPTFNLATEALVERI